MSDQHAPQHHRSEFLRTLAERGFIHQCSNFASLDALAAEGKVVAYVGYDCTASSLHIGNLVSIMMLHWLQRTGNKPITLMGGGTSMVGDPSGKDETRKLLTVEQIAANKDSIRQVFSRLLTFGNGPHDAVMVDNADWLTRLNYIDMLRDIGRHFSVNRMLAMDSIRLRLERDQEMSFIEFNYMILQSFDFVQLAKGVGCNLQMGGSDQWGNIVNGVDLGRRMGTHLLHALTTPLLTTAAGSKMGKTATGAVWLNEAMLSPYDYWQFWRNTEDADVGRFLKLFTTLPMAEIDGLSAGSVNEAKKRLATEATALIHGRDAATKAEETARRTFEEGEIGSDSLPTFGMSRDSVLGMGVLSALTAIGFAKSNGEARRAIEGGAIRLNGTVVSDAQATLSPSDVSAEGIIAFAFGRKRHALIKVG